MTTSLRRLSQLFVPIDVPGPGVLCPRLESLRIDYLSLHQKAELMPIFKDIVILRAIIGSPLKSFTICVGENPKPKTWQLIGKDKSFMVEEVVSAQWFKLDI